MNSISLAPLFVEKLLELFMCYEFFVSIENGDVKVCIVVTSVGLGLQQGLYLVLCCAFLQHFYGKVLTLLCDIIEVFVKVLDLVGVLLSLESVLQALLHGIVLLDVLRLFESHRAVDWAGASFEQLDLLEIIFVNSPSVVSNQSEPSSV